MFFNMSPRAWVDPKGKISIGEDVLISHDVNILLHTHEEAKYKWNKEMERHEVPTELKIGDGVFIGFGALILPQCNSIGENSIIGAGSVVTKDIPANEVWAGNPAKRLRKRFFKGRKDVLCK